MSITRRSTFSIDDLGSCPTSKLIDHLCQFEAIIETLGKNKNNNPVLEGIREEVREALAEAQDELARRAEERAKKAITMTKGNDIIPAEA